MSATKRPSLHRCCAYVRNTVGVGHRQCTRSNGVGLHNMFCKQHAKALNEAQQAMCLRRVRDRMIEHIAALEDDVATKADALHAVKHLHQCEVHRLALFETLAGKFVATNKSGDV